MRDAAAALERLSLRWYLTGSEALASLIRRDGSGKIDHVRDADPCGRVAMERRVRWQHPTWGPVWASSLEDLLVAKLEWSAATSELQLRDCALLLRMNSGSIDRRYLERRARELGVAHLLADLTRKAPDEA